jgi:uncharacterized protein
MRRFDLRSLRFHQESETWRRFPVDVAPFTFGGLDYSVPSGVVDLELRAARVGDRLTLHALFETEVDGACQRCLGEARVAVEGRGLEYVARGESETAVDDEEEDVYVHDYVVDVERWVRDLIADALPVQFLCREDCRGLCPVCGADLNADPAHSHGEAASG